MRDSSSYKTRVRKLSDQIKSTKGEAIGLNKTTSNLFRSKLQPVDKKLDVSQFNHVLEVNADQGWIDVEGMTQYQHIIAASLKHNVMPTVVPQLKSITIGGATVGGGIEASSFKYGFVHETILEANVLLSSGEVVLARPDNEHADLFYGLGNSYGTLGYILRLKVKAVPTKPYVKLQHFYFSDPKKYFEAFQRRSAEDIDFLDGVIFKDNEMYLTVAEFSEFTPSISDYTYQNIFYKSIQDNKVDYLTTKDFIWRWDTDWFWCSKNLGAQNPILRRIYGKKHLNSITYTKLMNFNKRWNITGSLKKIHGLHQESVIQDVEIPIENATRFLDFFHQEIGLLPIWVCPVRSYHDQVDFPLYQTIPGKLYINFGFWDVISGQTKHPVGHYNKKIERQVIALRGKKSLYSDVYLDEKTFWRQYNQPAYDSLKRKYDPTNKLRNLYDQVT